MEMTEEEFNELLQRIRNDQTDESVLWQHLEAVQLDAARYRWLRHGDHDEMVMRTYADGVGTRPFDPNVDNSWLFRGDELDAAIDAQLARGSGAGS